MYRLSARQILAVALLSALFAAGAIAVVDRLANRLQPSGAAFTGTAPAGITDPATATDEQNSLEISRTLSPGVVNIHSTSYARDFFGFVEPQEGSGSRSLIDQGGNILTNYHLIEGAAKLKFRFRGQKNYAARVVGGVPDVDLAVIKLTERPTQPLTITSLGDS